MGVFNRETHYLDVVSFSSPFEGDKYAHAKTELPHDGQKAICHGNYMLHYSEEHQDEKFKTAPVLVFPNP